MELNGALSNPRVVLEVSGLVTRHARLLAKAVVSPRKPRAVPAGLPPVLRSVTQVLEAAGGPMRVRRHSPVVREHARKVNLIRVTQDVPIGR